MAGNRTTSAIALAGRARPCGAMRSRRQSASRQSETSDGGKARRATEQRAQREAREAGTIAAAQARREKREARRQADRERTARERAEFNNVGIPEGGAS